MRDIPIFTTEKGVASLVLSQIPYTRKAYIHIQSTENGAEFLQECISFCVSAGAEAVYAAGHPICENYPVYTSVMEMRAHISSVPDTDAALFPVTEQTLEKWRQIYNEKVKNVPAGSWMSIHQAKKMTDGYFVHRDGTLLGIGKISCDRIDWIASCKPGAGKDVVCALCHALTGDAVTLEVASANKKAVDLYEKLGFIPTKELLKWYQVK